VKNIPKHLSRPWRQIGVRFLAVCGVIMLFFSGDCNESLSPRDEPVEFLQATLAAPTGVATFARGATFPSDLAGSVIVSLKNVYTEVLQESSLVRARVQIWLKEDPSVRAEIIAGENDLVNYQIVHFNVATLEPNSSALFLKQWNHQTSDGRFFWCFAHRYHEGFTQLGERYLLTDTLRFVAQADVQLFKNVQPRKTGQVEFDLGYRIFMEENDPSPCQ
jgi:hypothetical protein